MLTYGDHYTTGDLPDAGVDSATATWLTGPDAIDPVTGKAPWWFGTFINVKDDLKTYGPQLSVSWLPVNNLILKGTYGMTEYSTDATTYTNAFPLHLLKLNMHAKFLQDRLSFFFTQVYQAGRYNSGSKITARENLFARNITMASVAYTVAERVTAKLSVKNPFRDHGLPISHNLGPKNTASGPRGVEKKFVYMGIDVRL